MEECPSHLPTGSCKPGDYVSRERWGKVGGLTHTEQKAQLSFWAMLAAPLILGNDPRQMSNAELRILTAREVLDISQDSLGRQAVRVKKEGRISTWRKDLSSGAYALLLHNGGNAAAHVTVVWKDVFGSEIEQYEEEVPREPPCSNKHNDAACAGWAKSGECKKNAGYMSGACAASCGTCPPPLYEGRVATALVRDVWEAEYVGLHTARYEARNIDPHEARLVTVTFARSGGRTGNRAALEGLVEEERLQKLRRAAAPEPAANDAANDASGGHDAAQKGAESHGARAAAPVDGAASGRAVSDGSAAPAALPHVVQHRLHAQHEPPTMNACVLEHLDTLIVLCAGCAILTLGIGYVGLGRARRRGLWLCREVSASLLPDQGKISKMRARGADRPHAV